MSPSKLWLLIRPKSRVITPPKPEEQSYSLREDWKGLVSKLSLRLVALGIIVCIIFFGGSGYTFNISEREVNGMFMSIENQLVIFGVVNKILDYLVQLTLTHISSTHLTTWMTHPRTIDDGPTLDDFELQNELVNPWHSVTRGFARWRRSNTKRKSRKAWIPLRSVLSVAISISVLFLGGGINVIGIPKRRWYPDFRFQSQTSPDSSFTGPRMRLDTLDFNNIWDDGWQMLRVGGEPSWAVSFQAHAFSASDTFLSLRDLYNVMNSDRSQPGWYPLYTPDAHRLSGLNVTTNSSSTAVQTLAVQAQPMIDMFHDQQANSTKRWARTSVGWHATLRLTVPLLNTSCVSLNQPTEEQGEVVASILDSGTNSTITVDIGPSTNFTGVRCSINVQQGLFPVNHWIVDETTDPPSFSINNYGHDYNPTIDYIDNPIANAAVASALAAQFNTITPSLNALFSNPPDILNFTAYTLTLARALTFLNRGITTDADGCAAVYGALFSRLATTASWTMSTTGQTATHGPVQFQVYGSGPRLPWEWVISSSLGVIILVLCYDIYGIVIRRVNPGPWLSVGGMLLAANRAPTVDGIGGGAAVGLAMEKVRDMRWFLRRIPGDFGTGTRTGIGTPVGEGPRVRLVNDYDPHVLETTREIEKRSVYNTFIKGYTFSPRKTILWANGSTQAFMEEAFPGKLPLNHDGLKLERGFSLCNMIRIAGFHVRLTTNLSDHLRFMDEGKTVMVFHHTSFLQGQRRSPFFPPGLIDETLPDELDYLVLPCGSAQRRIDEYNYRHDRLVILKEAFDESRPATISQWWNNRRHSTFARA
ncbi:hypothetical protein BDW59DRAFT_157920 [Aspergillus cavernicola]|uniref:Uncharacterized protein n=1 Tax=Aspergillus cavernicola TaxID=176166 RepID=A0ABR4IUS7_9EURO